MKFRKKPVVIEAVQVKAADFNGSEFDGSPFSEAPEWLKAALHLGIVSVYPSDTDYALWKIKTLEDGPNGEAKHIAEPGDWIICGVKGELYPCKPDIFAATYEAADGAQPVSVQAEPTWQPITKPGQVKVGDKLRFDLCGEPKTHTVKQVLDAGTEREEIIYHKGKNWYVITSMAIAGTGSQKNIEFLSRAAPPVADSQDAAQEEDARIVIELSTLMDAPSLHTQVFIAARCINGWPFDAAIEAAKQAEHDYGTLPCQSEDCLRAVLAEVLRTDMDDEDAAMGAQEGSKS